MYLVTGGSGFIGSALVKRLVQLNYQVRVFDNNSRGKTNRLNSISDQIEIVNGDIRDKQQVAAAMQGVTGVFHLACVNGTEYFYSKSDLVLDVGVKGMCNVLDACIENKVKKFILASSAEVYQTPNTIPTDETTPLVIPDPLNARYSYGGTKIISEIMAINYSKYFEQMLIFRPHNIYGPDMGQEHVIPQLLLKIKSKLAKSQAKSQIDLPIQGNGQETRAFCYIEDLISGLIILLENCPDKLGIYNIGTMDEVSILELVATMGKIINQEINIITGELTDGSTLRRCPDITKISKLGYQPQVSLSSGIEKTLNFYMQLNVDCFNHFAISQ
jgi:nucleoside-diphosphate-sugar epimerase